MRPVLVALVAACSWFAAPYIIAGPDDLEEFFTGTVSTKLAVDAALRGALPFWTPDMALGLPQPLRFHFISHPLAPLCALEDCHQVLRFIASLHILGGVLVTAALVHRITASRVLAAVSGLSLLCASSTVQPTLVDDWAITAVNEASLPLLVYSGLVLLSAAHWRDKLFWTLALGGLAGLLLSMSFPVVVLLLTAAVLAATPRLLARNVGWLCLAGVLTLAIGAGQVAHLLEQVQNAPPGIARSDHEEPETAVTLWSTFVRPFVSSEVSSWRTVFFGPPFAIAALIGLLVPVRSPLIWPLRIGLIVSVLGLLVPERLLFDVITTRWAYRTGINFFGIVLAAWAIHRLRERGRARHRFCAYALVAAQAAAVVIAVWPAWRPVALAALTPGTQGERRLASDGELASRLGEIHARQPGRFAFTHGAYQAVRQLRVARRGLAPNQLPMKGVPTLNVVAYGLSLDALSPDDALLIGNTPPPRGPALQAQHLRVLAVRHLVALTDDEVPAGLIPDADIGAGLRVLNVPDAWPEAYFVSQVPTARLPRLSGCNHDRFLCADFGTYDFHRLSDEPLTIERAPDGITLRFAPQHRVRNILLTYWWQPYWRVTAGRARAIPAAEQLTALVVEPGESTVSLSYFPPVRGTLFLAGTVTELGTLFAIALLVLRRRRDGAEPQSLRESARACP